MERVHVSQENKNEGEDCFSDATDPSCLHCQMSACLIWQHEVQIKEL